MNIGHKIALYTLCLFLTLSWVTPCVTNIIKTATEKKIADKKEALPESKTDNTEEKKIEIILDSSVFFNVSFQPILSRDFLFSRGTTLPQSIILDLSNPPPEFHLFA